MLFRSSSTIITGTVTHSLTAALDQLRVVASSTSNDPGPLYKKISHIIIIIIINEKINVAFSRRTARTRNSHTKHKPRKRRV